MPSLQARERKEKQVMEELKMMLPALKPLQDPETGELTKRTVEMWLPEKKIRAWNTRCAPNSSGSSKPPGSIKA